MLLGVSSTLTELLEYLSARGRLRGKLVIDWQSSGLLVAGGVVFRIPRCMPDASVGKWFGIRAGITIKNSPSEALVGHRSWLALFIAP